MCQRAFSNLGLYREVMDSLIYMENNWDANSKLPPLLHVYTDPGTFHLNSLEVMFPTSQIVYCFEFHHRKWQACSNFLKIPAFFSTKLHAILSDLDTELLDINYSLN